MVTFKEFLQIVFLALSLMAVGWCAGESVAKTGVISLEWEGL